MLQLNVNFCHLVDIILLVSSFQDPFGEKRGKFDFASILKRLESLKTTIDGKLAEKGISMESESGSDIDS